MSTDQGLNSWRRWLQAPATHRLHKVLFQVHLWLGIGFGIYVLLISVSGSAIVLRPQFSRWFVSSQVEQVHENIGSEAEIRAAIAAAYQGYSVNNVVISTRPERAVYVALEKSGVEQTRYFDQYQRVDLGSTYPWPVASVEWLTRFHDELLLGRDGVKLNGLGGILFLLMVVSGLMIWWQGSKRWYQGLIIRPSAKRSILWQLHSFLGIWSLLLMFAWGLTAVYFAWPQVFESLMDWFDDDLQDFDRPDGWLQFLIKLHFGRFRGALWGSVLWIVLGLLPAVMFISGFILWYKKLKPRV